MQSFIVVLQPPGLPLAEDSENVIVQAGDEWHGRMAAVKNWLGQCGLKFLSHCDNSSYSMICGFFTGNEFLGNSLPGANFGSTVYLSNDRPENLPQRPFTFASDTFQGAESFLFSDLSLPGQQSAYHQDRQWNHKLICGVSGDLPPAYNNILLHEPNEQGNQDAVINPLVIEINISGNEISRDAVGDRMGPEPDLVRLLEAKGIRAVIPLLTGNSRDLEWRFLQSLSSKLSAKELPMRDWPAAFRLFFAPSGEDLGRLVDPEPFFVLDQLGGTFVIAEHGEGDPIFDWVPPRNISTNHHWIATYFYRQWKQVVEDTQGHLLEFAANNEKILRQLVASPISRTSRTQREFHSSQCLEPSLGGILTDMGSGEGPRSAAELGQLIENLDSWQNYHMSEGYLRGDSLRGNELHEALCRQALPQSPIRVQFPPKTEEFSLDLVYDCIESRFRGASAWMDDLLSWLQDGPFTSKNGSLYMKSIPREKGEEWWYQWAEWLSTEPADLYFPEKKSLRLDDPRTPLDYATPVDDDDECYPARECKLNNRTPQWW